MRLIEPTNDHVVLPSESADAAAAETPQELTGQVAAEPTEPQVIAEPTEPVKEPSSANAETADKNHVKSSADTIAVPRRSKKRKRRGGHKRYRKQRRVAAKQQKAASQQASQESKKPSESRPPSETTKTAPNQRPLE